VQVTTDQASSGRDITSEVRLDQVTLGHFRSGQSLVSTGRVRFC